MKISLQPVYGGNNRLSCNSILLLFLYGIFFHRDATAVDKGRLSRGSRCGEFPVRGCVYGLAFVCPLGYHGGLFVSSTKHSWPTTETDRRFFLECAKRVPRLTTLAVRPRSELNWHEAWPLSTRWALPYRALITQSLSPSVPFFFSLCYLL